MRQEVGSVGTKTEGGPKPTGFDRYDVVWQKLVFHIYGAFAGFERNLIRNQTMVALQTARSRRRSGDHSKPQNVVTNAGSLWKLHDRRHVPKPDLPDGRRVAWLQVDDRIGKADLVFRVRRLRKLPSLPMVCAHETIEGKERGINCSNCRVCW